MYKWIASMVRRKAQLVLCLSGVHEYTCTGARPSVRNTADMEMYPRLIDPTYGVD